MQAIIIRRPGGPEVLELTDLPVPRPGEGQVLVRAKSIGVGKPDVLFRTGVYRWMPPLPAIVGSELTGTVEALGAGVTGLSEGQRVWITMDEGEHLAAIRAGIEDMEAGRVVAFDDVDARIRAKLGLPRRS